MIGSHFSMGTTSWKNILGHKKKKFNKTVSWSNNVLTVPARVWRNLYSTVVSEHTFLYFS